MAKKKQGELKLELIGGIYIVEAYKDGTERREEIDGTAVLKMLEWSLKKSLEEKAP